MTRHDAPDHREIQKPVERAEAEGNLRPLDLLRQAKIGNVDATAAPFLAEVRKDPKAAWEATRAITRDGAQLTDDLRSGRPVDLEEVARVSRALNDRTLAAAASVKSIQDRLEKSQAQI